MSDEAKFEKGPEADPIPTGRNADGEPVGLGVPVRPLEAVLERRFADMNRLQPLSRNIVDSRIDSRGRPRPTARPLTDRRNTSAGRSDKTDLERDYEEARRLLERGRDPIQVSRETNLGLTVVQGIHRSIGS